MEFTSIHDILEFSISKERTSVRFFEDLASKTNIPATKSLFEVLVQREKEHVEELELEMEKLGYTVETGAEPQNNALFRWEESIEGEGAIGDMNFVEALLLGIQKERASFRLYTQIMASIDDKELKGILFELAEEEMRHVLQLEEQYEAMVHPKH